MSDVLIILGMHRSGTSALTGVLCRLGFSVGKNLLSANQFNPRGYYENSRLTNYLDNFLRSIGRTWSDQRLLPEGWLDSDASKEAVSDISKIILEEYDLQLPIVIKDPRFCRLVPLLKMVFDEVNFNPHYIFSIRHPIAVMNSLCQRDFFRPQHSALLYLAHLLEAELYTRDESRCFVNYEDLILDWRSVIRRIGVKLSLETLSANDLHFVQEDNVSAFISADLDHGPEDVNVPYNSYSISLAKEIHSHLSVASLSDAQLELDHLRSQWIDLLKDLTPSLDQASMLRDIFVDLPRSLVGSSLEVERAACVDASSTVYWSTNIQRFTEKNKISLSWNYGLQSELKFTLPEISDRIKYIRWDITDRPAFCKLQRFWIECPADTVRWEWNLNEPIFSFCSEDMRVLSFNNGKCNYIFSTGFDPYGLVSLPPSILQSLDAGWRICATFQPDLPVTAFKLLIDDLVEKDKRILEIEKRVILHNDEKEIIEANFAELRGRHFDLNRKFSSLRMEIVKAESQLALLKDLTNVKFDHEKL